MTDKKRKQYPTQARLRELFDYDPDGFLVWRKRDDIPSHLSKRDDGIRAGSLNVDDHGFVRQKIMINYKSYETKVLIWIWHHGDPGEKYIKNKNRLDLDSRIENLFLSKNTQSHRPPSFKWASKSGFAGVVVTKTGNYRSEIQFQGKRKCLGTFFDALDAAIAFDNEYEKSYGVRPNETIMDEVKPITRAEAVQYSRMKKCKEEGSHMGVEKSHKNRYIAKLCSKCVGTAGTPEDAARLYNIAAFEKYGESAVLNDVPNPLERPRFHKNVKTASGHVGVTKNGSRWAATYKGKHIGQYDTKEQAARAYNIAAYEHYGEHAVLNDIPDPLGHGDVF